MLLGFYLESESGANAFKCPSHFLFYEVQCRWLYVRSLIHLDLSFVNGDRYGYILILLHVDIQVCQHNLLNMLSLFRFIVFDYLSKIRCS